MSAWAITKILVHQLGGMPVVLAKVFVQGLRQSSHFRSSHGRVEFQRVCELVDVVDVVDDVDILLSNAAGRRVERPGRTPAPLRSCLGTRCKVTQQISG
jgi:hypothetical protein